MSIEDEGFLSNQVDKFIVSTNEQYKSLFSYCRDLNGFAQTLLYRFEIRNRMLNELIIGASYTHLLSSFQGSVLMAERGMINEMKVVTRNFLEITFLISAISKNKEIAKLFLANDEIQRKKLLNKYVSVDTNVIDTNILPEVNKMLEKIKDNINTQNIKPISVEYLSQQAELHDHYKTYYSLLSLSVHPSARELQNIFTFDDNNNITSINYGSSDKDIEKVLLSNCSYLLIAIKNIANIFTLDIENEISKLNGQLELLWQNKFKAT